MVWVVGIALKDEVLVEVVLYVRHSSDVRRFHAKRETVDTASSKSNEQTRRVHVVRRGWQCQRSQTLLKPNSQPLST